MPSGTNGGVKGVLNEPTAQPEVIHNITSSNPSFSLDAVTLEYGTFDRR